MRKEATKDNFVQYIRSLSIEAKNNPTRNYLTFQMFAGHGFIWHGHQCVATNVFDPRENYYELITVEQIIRSYRNLPNVYFLVMFACCRQDLQSWAPVIHKVPEISELTKEEPIGEPTEVPESEMGRGALVAK